MNALRMRSISGSTLKIIAVITMLADHIGAGVIGRMIMRSAANGAATDSGLYALYTFMRYAGRIAFPIYCFLLVEGFFYTRNVSRYAARLFVGAMISEVPFDILFNGKILEFSYQNVFFTLLIGLLAMYMSERIVQLLGSMGGNINAIKPFAVLAVTALGAWITSLLRTDYSVIGVICIMVLYYTRNIKPLQILSGVIAFGWEITAPLAFIPIAFYNHKRGASLKIIFYAFYPVHLALLAIICASLGILEYPIYNILPLPDWL